MEAQLYNILSGTLMVQYLNVMVTRKQLDGLILGEIFMRQSHGVMFLNQLGLDG
jgi:hypothetical protein